MTRRGAFGAIAAGLGVLLAGCSASLATKARLQYQITITCYTPDGVKTSSAVQEIMRYEPIEAIKPINVGTTEMYGDALVLSVNGKHYFFDLNLCSFLLDDATRGGTIQPPLHAMAGCQAQLLNEFKRADAKSVMDGKWYVRLPSRNFGLLSFSDESDYSTIKRVISKESGEGWALKTVVIEVTAEAITRQATRVLSWLNTLSREEVQKNPNDDGYLITRLANLSDRF